MNGFRECWPANFMLIEYGHFMAIELIFLVKELFPLFGK